MLPAQNHFANLNSFFKIVQGCQLYWFTFCNKNHQFLGKNYIDKLVPLLIQPLSYHFSHVFWSIWRKKWPFLIIITLDFWDQNYWQDDFLLGPYLVLNSPTTTPSSFWSMASRKTFYEISLLKDYNFSYQFFFLSQRMSIEFDDKNVVVILFLSF